MISKILIPPAISDILAEDAFGGKYPWVRNERDGPAQNVLICIVYQLTDEARREDADAVRRHKEWIQDILDMIFCETGYPEVRIEDTNGYIQRLESSIARRHLA